MDRSCAPLISALAWVRHTARPAHLWTHGQSQLPDLPRAGQAPRVHGVAPRPAQVCRLVLRGLRIEPWLLQRGTCPTWRSLQAARDNSYEWFLQACRELGGF